MEELIGIFIFYIIYTVFQLLQKKAGGDKKAPPRPTMQKGRPVQPAGKTPKQEQRENIPEFLRRWLEEAEKLENEASGKQPDPEAPVELPVEPEPVTVDMEGGYAAKSLIELEESERKKRADAERQAQLKVLLEMGDTPQVSERGMEVKQLLGQSESLKNAFLLREILDQPLFYRKKGFPYSR